MRKTKQISSLILAVILICMLSGCGLLGNYKADTDELKEKILELEIQVGDLNQQNYNYLEAIHYSLGNEIEHIEDVVNHMRDLSSQSKDVDGLENQINILLNSLKNLKGIEANLEKTMNE